MGGIARDDGGADNWSSMITASVLFLLATVLPMARLTDYVARRDQERRLQRTL
jgi:polar amino acid transport system permease protein